MKTCATNQIADKTAETTARPVDAVEIILRFQENSGEILSDQEAQALADLSYEEIKEICEGIAEENAEEKAREIFWQAAQILCGKAEVNSYCGEHSAYPSIEVIKSESDGNTPREAAEDYRGAKIGLTICVKAEDEDPENFETARMAEARIEELEGEGKSAELCFFNENGSSTDSEGHPL